MAEDLYINAGSKTEKYRALLPQLKNLLAGEDDLIANLSNVSAALKETFRFFWVGFYLVKGEELVLGPFQGPIACTRIRKGRGVCGTAWDRAETLVVPDVDAFPGHIACSSLSRSEIVVPLKREDGEVWGVLDIDSDDLGSFDKTDARFLEEMIKNVMIRKLSAFLFLAFIGWGCLQAQEAKTCFKNMPDSICPLLSAVNRADFIDFLESKMKAEVTNSLGGKSEMTKLSPDYIHVKMTPQGSWQMKLLPVNDSTKVICVVATVCAPACDSHVKFYNTDWKELTASSYLPALPVLDDFIAEASDTVDVYEYQDARRQADMLLMKADLSAEDATLTFTFTTTDYMGKEAAEKLKPFVRRFIVYTWNQGKFEKSSTSL